MSNTAVTAPKPAAFTSAPELGLRAGDWVVVRSKEEILATLDSLGRLEGMPFQPEMWAWCGKRLKVQKSAHKTCDTIHKSGGRGIHAAVHLEGARCDGAKHAGCMADCVFFWKEAWLRPEGEPSAAPVKAPAGACTEAIVEARVKAPGQENEPDPAWVCQTTALFEASTPLKWWDVRQYIKDVTSGNHSAWAMFKLLFAANYRALVHRGIGYSYLVGFYNFVQKIRGGEPYPEAVGKIPDGQPTPVEKLTLKVGDWVEVRSREEIEATMTVNGFNRGMRFDIEMLKYCGHRYRVQLLVDRLLHEVTGKLIPMKTACIQLEDVYCRATCTDFRLGCPRMMPSYWRQIWLKQVDGPKGA